MNTKLCMSALVGILVITGVGCANEMGEAPSFPGDIDSAPAVENGKADAWDYRNDPRRLVRHGLNYRFSELPTSGEAEHQPWADSYWPYYQDSTNYRWQGPSVMSPMELYDAAFNGWTPADGFMDLRPMTQCGADYDADYYDGLGPAATWMTRNKGNWNFRNGVDDDDDGEIDNCDGAAGERIETWWGLCHAWAPAAMLEDEPLRAVDYNGQRFEASDIKALIITAYDRTVAYMLGGRCNDEEVEMDEQGRPMADQCRDTNAGALHVILANLLGVNNTGFQFDRTYDYEVWNQPVVGYEVLESVAQTAAEANTRLGVSGDTYSFNTNATAFQYVRTRVDWITESHASVEPTTPNIARWTRADTYEYILELDADGKIIGGEYVGSSRTAHPDFLWLGIRAGSGSNPHVRLDNVRRLIELSRATEEDTTPTDATEFNATDVPVTIPDNTSSGATSVINVTSDDVISGVSVSANVTHTWAGDLRVELRHGGRTVVLSDREGGSRDDVSVTRLLTDFDGLTAGGAWELFVSDNARYDNGTIESFSISLGGGSSTAVMHDYTNSTTVDIPDNNAAGITSTIDVPDTFDISGLRVAVDIEHTYRGDLIVTLQHDGVSHVLHQRAGGGSNDLIRSFDVGAFNGNAANGTWTLAIQDRARIDTGRLRSWSLHVQE